jgi:hypothetical protein
MEGIHEAIPWIADSAAFASQSWCLANGLRFRKNGESGFH